MDTADSFSFLNLFLQADWVVKAVLVGLAAASVWSWAVIIDKGVRFRALNREADRFEDQVSAGRSLEEVAQEAGDSRHPLPRLLNAALREWRDAKGKGTLAQAQAAMLIQRIDRVLDSLIARESQRVDVFEYAAPRAPLLWWHERPPPRPGSPDRSPCLRP